MAVARHNQASDIEDVSIDDPRPYGREDVERPDDAPLWLWVLVPAEGAPEGLDVRAARAGASSPKIGKAKVPQLPDIPENAPAFTTPAAARYCGFRSRSGLLKASYRGLVKSLGPRGGDGPLMWAVSELNRFNANRTNDDGMEEAVGIRTVDRTRTRGDLPAQERGIPLAGHGDAPAHRTEEGQQQGRSRSIAAPSDPEEGRVDRR